MSEGRPLGSNEAAVGKEPASDTTPGPAPAVVRVPAIVVGLFLVAAVFTRFYQLGERPLHHDESIH
ncbi:MAG TPA: hypothetical protein VFW15_15635, partial [Thermoanaerobaculia bacterium]|nr:hypothetical protein [Thermoanaerobaculia bacterium]